MYGYSVPTALPLVLPAAQQAVDSFTLMSSLYA